MHTTSRFHLYFPTRTAYHAALTLLNQCFSVPDITHYDQTALEHDGLMSALRKLTTKDVAVINLYNKILADSQGLLGHIFTHKFDLSDTANDIKVHTVFVLLHGAVSDAVAIEMLDVPTGRISHLGTYPNMKDGADWERIAFIIHRPWTSPQHQRRRVVSEQRQAVSL